MTFILFNDVLLMYYKHINFTLLMKYLQNLILYCYCIIFILTLMFDNLYLHCQSYVHLKHVKIRHGHVTFD